MPLTVTATADATNAYDDVVLKVYVVTSGTEAGGAVTTGVLEFVPPDFTLTPNGNGSLIVAALSDVQAASETWTPATHNTTDNNGGPTAQGAFWWYGHYTGTVTASSAVTLGCTETANTYFVYAGYEVLASGTPAIDASTPAAVTGSPTAATTASFSPPASAVLVALVLCDGADTQTIGVSDSSSLTWTQRGSEFSSGFGGTAVVFTATVPGGGGSTVALTAPNLALAAPLVSVKAGATVALTAPNVALAAPLLSPKAGATVALTAPNLALAAPLVSPKAAAVTALTAPNVALAAPVPSVSAAATVALTAPNLALAAPLVTASAGGTPQSVSLTAPNVALAAPVPGVSAGATVALTAPNLALAAPVVTPAAGTGAALTAPNLVLAAPAVSPSAGAVITLTAPGVALAAPVLAVTAGGRVTLTAPGITLAAPVLGLGSPQQGTASITLAASSVTIRNALTGSVTIVNDL